MGRPSSSGLYQGLKMRLSTLNGSVNVQSITVASRPPTIRTESFLLSCSVTIISSFKKDKEPGGAVGIGYLKREKLLSDVPKKPTLSDVDTLICLELGSAVRISFLKLDSTTFDVVVMNTATLKDLKFAIKKNVNDVEQSKMGHRQMSWRHVWSNFCLLYDNRKLQDDDCKLQDFGIRSSSQVQFVPCVLPKNSGGAFKQKETPFFHCLSKQA